MLQMRQQLTQMKANTHGGQTLRAEIDLPRGVSKLSTLWLCRWKQKGILRTPQRLLLNLHQTRSLLHRIGFLRPPWAAESQQTALRAENSCNTAGLVSPMIINVRKWLWIHFQLTLVGAYVMWHQQYSQKEWVCVPYSDIHTVPPRTAPELPRGDLALNCANLLKTYWTFFEYYPTK